VHLQFVNDGNLVSAPVGKLEEFLASTRKAAFRRPFILSSVGFLSRLPLIDAHLFKPRLTISPSCLMTSFTCWETLRFSYLFEIVMAVGAFFFPPYFSTTNRRFFSPLFDPATVKLDPFSVSTEEHPFHTSVQPRDLQNPRPTCHLPERSSPLRFTSRRKWLAGISLRSKWLLVFYPPVRL